MLVKKSLLFACILLSLSDHFTLLLAQELPNLRFGISTNIAASRITGDLSSSNFLVRPSFGLTVDKTVNNRIHVNGQIIYATYGNVQHFSGAAPGEKYITTYRYLLVPVVLRISKQYSRLWINVGMQGGYLLGKNYEHINAPLGGGSTSGLVGTLLKNIDIGGVTGLGYTFSKSLQGDFRYYQSFTKLFKDYVGANPVTGTGTIVIPGSKAYNQSFSIGIIYYL